MFEPEWRYKPVDESSVTQIAETFNLPRIIARIMSIRGINSKNISREFFYPDIHKLHNSFLMKDMDKTVDRILSAISDKKTILIFGDYDVDGITSTSFLTLFFRSIGIDAQYYVPSRSQEGYGLSKKGIQYAHYIGADILITCDCGINSFEEIVYANELSLDVIITDHHKPAGLLPEAFSVINPHRQDCTYPFKGLCGAGVVFKLALGICEKGNFNSRYVWQHADLVTLGIAADLVPIIEENRIIVHYGIKQMTNQTNPGLTALLKTGNLWGKDITVGKLIFWIAPKINAAGRLGDASRAVKLLTTQNPVFAMEIAHELEKENNLRKDLTLNMTNEAIHLVQTTCNLNNEKAIVLGQETWHPGIIGIVASRIKEMFNRPVVIISMINNEYKGSCRSISGFDIVDTLRECKEYFIGFGGHPMAAGLSIKSVNYQAFKQKFIQIANDKISSKDIDPKIYIDSKLNLYEVNDRMIKFLNSMEPYGPGNVRPIFVSKNLVLDGIPKLIGKDQSTLKFSVKQQKTLFESIGFNMAEHYEKLIKNAPIDIAYVIGENIWNGEKAVQLELKDIKLSKNNV